MARSLFALWVTLVAAILTISVLAQLWIQQRETASRERIREILLKQLEPVSDSIGRVIENYSFELQRLVAGRELGVLQDCVDVSRSPLVHLLVIVNHDLELRFPVELNRLSTDRRTLVEEALQLIREQEDSRPRVSSQSLSTTPPSQTAEVGQLRPSSAIDQSASLPDSRNAQRQQTDSQFAIQSLEREATPPTEGIPPVQPPEGFDQQSSPQSGFGWLTWYHRRGIVLGLWWKPDTNWRSILILPRARWMADIVAALPDTQLPQAYDENNGSIVNVGDQLAGGSLQQLVDVEGQVIYQWGDAPADSWEVLAAEQATAEFPVSNPLEGWRLRVFASGRTITQLGGDNLVMPIWTAVVGIASALVLGGVLVSVNVGRQLRLAANRVSFVNQVSHELRTPLTNICMYADLLADDIRGQDDELDGKTQQLRRLGVIQNESRRLNRLINNVLEFARASSKSKTPRMSCCVLDSLVQDVLSTFQPRLSELGFTVRTDLLAGEPRMLDQEAVEQILVNLIGNAEKYAAEGKFLEIVTRGTETQVEIQVNDQGPGVPSRMVNKIFQPFERVSDRLEDPAGTGIGLTIVRESARRHGGDCRLMDSKRGAAFRCTLTAPITREKVF